MNTHTEYVQLSATHAQAQLHGLHAAVKQRWQSTYIFDQRLQILGAASYCQSHKYWHCKVDAEFEHLRAHSHGTSLRCFEKTISQMQLDVHCGAPQSAGFGSSAAAISQEVLWMDWVGGCCKSLLHAHLEGAPFADSHVISTERKSNQGGIGVTFDGIPPTLVDRCRHQLE